MSWSFSPMSFSSSFLVLGLTFRCLIHFELIFTYGVRQISTLVLLHVDILFSQCCLLKKLSLPPWVVLVSLSKIIWPVMCGFISGFSIPLVCVSAFMLVPLCFDYHSFVISFEVKKYEIFNFVPSRIVLVMWDSLTFHMILGWIFLFLQKILLWSEAPAFVNHFSILIFSKITEIIAAAMSNSSAASPKLCHTVFSILP